MNYSVRKFTALLLALIMVLSVAPLDAVASVFSTYEANVVVDTSNSAHLTENFFTQSAKTPDGNTAGSVLVGTLREDSLLNGSTVEFSEVAEKPSLRKAVATTSGKRVIAKYNITVKNPDGSVWQPDQKSGETVDVRVTLNNPVQLNPGDRLSLVHESDGQEVPATFYKNANDEMTGFDFEARGFSVYAVVAEGVDARLEVKFNSNGSDIATIWVKKSDLANQTEFEKIVYDPGTGTLPAGVIFLGWTDEPDYELPDEDFTPMTIADIRTAVTEKLNSGVHDIEEATNGDSVTYYAVLAKQYRISYLGDGGVSVGEDVINFRYNAETPNPEVEYTVNMTYTPKDNEHAFMGWLVSEGGNNITGHTEEKVYENETIITISGDVTFAVDAPQGHWLVFDENGKGATYCAPQFVKSGETTHLPRPDAEMVRKGYRFGGWYDTKEHADAHGTDPTITTGQYAFGGELDDGVTIYASWISETTAVYTVIFWTQNQARTGYDVAGSVVVSGTVGANIPYTSVDNIDEDYATGAGFGENGHYTGFCLTEGSKGQTVMIRPENDSVLNLYYDRIHYNFRFYVYRDSRSGQNRYTFADNSGSGRSLDDLVTWNPADRNHPTVNGYTMDSERVGNYDYYFFTLSAYYGEDISSKWPKYDQIQGVGSLQPVSFVMMVGTKLKPNPTNGGSGTVKGIISVLNENILGATNQANGNYVIIRFPAQGYNNWRYHIWFETVEGVDYTGKTTKEYNGRTYYEDNIMEVRSSNLQVNSQNEPKYDGFDFVGKRGQNWTITNINDNSAWTTTENGTTLHHLNYLYNRQVFKISYFDGNYVDGNGNTIQNRATHLLHESRAIGQGADVTADEYAKYIPELPEGELGFIFEGWYTDEGCTSPYTFAKMPIDGIKVYAKWRQIQYRVFLHSMVPASDTTLNWGSANQKMNFRISYGGKISAPYGTRTGYEFSGWYTNPQYNGVFNAENYVLNEQTVSTPYDKSAHLTDPHTIYDGYGTETNEDDDRDWITKEFNLYAKWSKILIGATGIGVKYDEGEGSNPPSDTNLYVDQAKAVAQSASTAPDGKVFAYWVVQKWNGTEYTDTDVHVYPGAQFIVNADDAKVTPHTDDPTKNDYVVQLRAEYVDPIGPPTTHIWWFRNDGTEAFRKDDPIQVNKSVAIEGALTRSGYRFIGWAKVQQNGDTPATTTDAGPYLYYGDDGAFHLGSKTGTKVSKVAADERTPYDNMYAVWIPELKIRITGNTDTKEYNGQEQSVTGYTVEYSVGGGAYSTTAPSGVSVALAEGKTAEAAGTNVNTNPGYLMGLNSESFTISVNAEKYDFNATDDLTITDGWLKITPKKVTITAKDASKEYDGTALTQPEFTVSGLAEGDTHTFTVVMTEDSTITDVGTQPNVIATVDGVAVTTGTETAVGNYLVTTANGTLKITPKKVTITAKDASKEYDGTALTQPEFTVSGLAEGDTHTFTVVMTEDSTITDVGTQPNVIATVDGVAVTTGTETAVGNYLVTTANGTLKITPKKVTITAKDASKEYDGTALTQPEFTVSGLAEGDTHTFTVVMTDDSTITDVGTQPNVIATVDGVAVTTGTETAVGNYLVTTANGTLKITPKKVTITAKDASKEYGTALTQPEFTVSGLAEGDTHTFTVVMTEDSTITDVGTQPNVIATVDGVAVTTGTETAVGNYLVTTANGTLKITPKKVTITAKDASKEYDGTALTQPEFTVSGLAEGDTHTFTVVMTEDSTITDVGTQPNVIATVDGVAVTTGTETAVGNYLVTTANGTLKITPKKVTITAKDASKEYDGTALTQPEFTVSGLAEGDTHTFTVVMTEDSTITDVGTQPNVIATVDGVAVTTGTETAVGNYLVTTANGTLKITPKKVTITAKDASKEYDGTALTQPEFTVSGLAEGDTHTFTVVMTEDSTITDVGTQPNVIATVDGVAVTTGTETAVGNYLVTTANGTLKITPKKVTITAKDASKEYDGTALTQPEFTVSGLAEGDTHTFTVVMTEDSTITDVGTQPNVIATVDGVAVTTGTETAVGNYLVTTANGTLKITPKKVTITAKDASKEYDGTALTQPEFTVSGLAEGDTHTFTVVMTDDSTITDVGTQPNVIATVDGVAVTTGTETAVGNYLVTTANGTLKITPKKVTITAKDASKEYDGTALTQPEFTVSGLAEGDTHTFTVVMTDDSTITDVGTQPNVIATVDGVAVTTGTETAVGNYLVTTANGTLKITPKKVTITAKDASKEYDGTALTQPEFTVSGLAEGDTHTFTVVMTEDSTITDVGTQPNVIATVVDGVAVTTGTETAVGNYLVTTANGTLKITPKKVTITAKDASKEYDGTALTQPEFTVSGLAEGDTHTFTVVMTDDSTITDVGTQPNVIATVDGVAVTTGTETAVGNYLVTTANGTLKITPKKVTITAKDASKEYDGTALTQPEFTVSGLAEGDTHTFTVVMTEDRQHNYGCRYSAERDCDSGWRSSNNRN
ncbi:InlB B-repeat-containing protein [Clostridiales bacterium FE2010]|nr:InlB B-repeat-containing protein [Clostridiales bacterium FE2010]